jgi:hypothetical protein
MLSQGDVLDGKFEVEDVVRRTEAFTLYRARDKDKKRSVLVRELPVTARERDKAVKLFLSEAQARMKVKHAALPEIYAAFEKDNYVYLVMEEVEGQTLKDFISMEYPEEPAVLHWASQLIGLLMHLKSRSSVTVRDLRPANIVMLDGGQLKIMDIGLSRILRGAAPVSKKKGTSPEIRALGGCLYELLTQIPAPELSDRPIAGELFRRVNLVNPDISEEFADAVERMVDPLSDPFQSLDEVKLYLGLSGQPIPKREKKKRERSPDQLFDPERIDPAEEKAALRTLLLIVGAIGLLLFVAIEWQRSRGSQMKASLVGEGQQIAGPKKAFKWTPDKIALKEYLDDLTSFATYEGKALDTHALIARKHQVQAATGGQFEKALQKTVIPNYQIFVDNIRAIVTPNEDIRQAHMMYVKGAKLQLVGFKELRKALHGGVAKDIDEANKFISQGNMYIGQWTQKIRELQGRYGLYADSDAPPAAVSP